MACWLMGVVLSIGTPLPELPVLSVSSESSLCDSNVRNLAAAP